MDAEVILKLLSSKDSLDSISISSELKEDHQKVVGAIKSLQSLGDVIKAEEVTSQQWQLTEEGKEVAEKGSHEVRVFEAVSGDGIEQAKINSLFPNAKIGLSKAIAAGWVQIDKKNGAPRVIRKINSVEDSVKDSLTKITSSVSNGVSDKIRQELKKRKLLQEVTTKSYLISKGTQFSTSIAKQEVELTREMLADGSWKDKTFKPYNFDALGTPAVRGHLHPLMKVRAEFRQIFLEMGFTEMPTNNYVESSFWNFDALYQPQQHPARDAHDTFFMTDPPNALHLPTDYMERVKKVHQFGGYGSQGYQYEWKESEARKNLLRTHTTAVSARMLYQVAQQVPFRPVKYFSIDRVFRNETLDATHLAEFCQIEGVIADRNLTLGDHIGVIHQFFNKLGIKKLKFKPAYNPYTEPSMEIYSYHEGLKKWVEIGNSGMFRPEMLLPMNLPSDVRVIAWGLSLERPTMILYGIDNIRDLVGPRVDLQMVHNNPICRLDKSSGSQEIEPKTQPAPTKSSFTGQEELVIRINPSREISSILTLLRLTGCRVSTHLHSSLVTSPPSIAKLDISSGPGPRVRLIWTSTVRVPSLYVVPNRVPIEGEVNVLRFVARMVQSSLYPSSNPERATLIDWWLDLVEEEGRRVVEKAGLSRLSSHDWLVGDGATLADLVVAPLMQNVKVASVKRWLDRCHRAFNSS